MPAFPAETPPPGVSVDITLSNAVALVAYWQDDQWWAGLNNDPHDVPIANGHVVSWELIA